MFGKSFILLGLFPLSFPTFCTCVFSLVLPWLALLLGFCCCFYFFFLKETGFWWCWFYFFYFIPHEILFYFYLFFFSVVFLFLFCVLVAFLSLFELGVFIFLLSQLSAINFSLPTNMSSFHDDYSQEIHTFPLGFPFDPGGVYWHVFEKFLQR